MRVGFVSSTGLTLGLAMRCENDGHDVRFMAPDHGNGLVAGNRESESWRPDVLVYDNDRFSSDADGARELGIKVLGPSTWSSTINTDDVYHDQVISAMGWSKNGIASGTNLYISAAFNGSQFVASFASLVYRRFMSGGLGPDLVCSGMIADFRGLAPRVQTQILKPLEKMLKKVNYRGFVHIHLLVNGDAFAVKEISACLAHPLSLLLFENTSLSASEVLLRLLDETSKPIPKAENWACGVKISVPPYPYQSSSAVYDVGGVASSNLRHMWLINMQRADGKYKTSGGGLIGFVTARCAGDPTHQFEGQEAVRRAYRTIKQLQVNDLQYRTDIGQNIKGLLVSLKQPGWLL